MAADLTNLLVRQDASIMKNAGKCLSLVFRDAVHTCDPLSWDSIQYELLCTWHQVHHGYGREEAGKLSSLVALLAAVSRYPRHPVEWELVQMELAELVVVGYGQDGA